MDACGDQPHLHASDGGVEHGDRGMEIGGPAAQHRQLPCCALVAAGLVETMSVELRHLVRPDDQAPRDSTRRRPLPWPAPAATPCRPAPRSRQGASSTLGRAHAEREPQAGKQLTSVGRSGSQHQHRETGHACAAGLRPAQGKVLTECRKNTTMRGLNFGQPGGGNTLVASRQVVLAGNGWAPLSSIRGNSLAGGQPRAGRSQPIRWGGLPKCSSMQPARTGTGQPDPLSRHGVCHAQGSAGPAHRDGRRDRLRCQRCLERLRLPVAVQREIVLVAGMDEFEQSADEHESVDTIPAVSRIDLRDIGGRGDPAGPAFGATACCRRVSSERRRAGVVAGQCLALRHARAAEALTL